MVFFSSIIAAFFFFFIITIHELGHYFASIGLKVKVKEFSIGIGCKLIKKKIKETLFCLRLIPIGGFIAYESSKKFDSQPVFKRMLITIAGPVSNIIAGFFLI